MNFSQRPKKILVADDHAMHLDFLSRLLSEMEFSVIQATDGQLMLEQARQKKPDLIIMDIFMPGMDGYTALTHLRGIAEVASIPVILMSAHSAVEAHRSIISAFERVDFIPKPIELDLLRQKLVAMGCLSTEG